MALKDTMSTGLVPGTYPRSLHSGSQEDHAVSLGSIMNCEPKINIKDTVSVMNSESSGPLLRDRVCCPQSHHCSCGINILSRVSLPSEVHLTHSIPISAFPFWDAGRPSARASLCSSYESRLGKVFRHFLHSHVLSCLECSRRRGHSSDQDSCVHEALLVAEHR